MKISMSLILAIIAYKASDILFSLDISKLYLVFIQTRVQYYSMYLLVDICTLYIGHT